MTWIVLRDDDGDWHWVAYAADGYPISTGWLRRGPRHEDRVRAAAAEQGVCGVDDAAVEIES